ncbi:MAG: hypothetical protein ACMG57_01025 [Candidatus Dojkabacteria bacterium]
MARLNGTIYDIDWDSIYVLQDNTDLTHKIDIFDLYNAAIEVGNKEMEQTALSLARTMQEKLLLEDPIRARGFIEKFSVRINLAEEIIQAKENRLNALNETRGFLFKNNFENIPYRITNEERLIILAFLSKVELLPLIRGQVVQEGKKFLRDYFLRQSKDLIKYFTMLYLYIEGMTFNPKININNPNMEKIDETAVLQDELDFAPITKTNEKVPATLEGIDLYRSETIVNYLRRFNDEINSNDYLNAGMSLSTIEFTIEQIRNTNTALWRTIIPLYTQVLTLAHVTIFDTSLPMSALAENLAIRLEKFRVRNEISNEDTVIKENPIDLSEVNFESAEVSLTDVLNAVRVMRKKTREVLPDPKNSQGLIINYQESFQYNKLFNLTNKELMSRENNPKAIMFLLRLHIQSREIFRRVFEYVAYEEATRYNANEVIVPALMDTVTDEPIVEKGSKEVVITYPKKVAADGNEEKVIGLDSNVEANFEWVMDELENRIKKIATTVDLTERPEGKEERERWELENIVSPLNDLMMIFNSQISMLLPAKSSETGKGKFIADDWDIMKKYVGLKDKQSFTDFIFAKISQKYLYRLLDLLCLTLDLLEMMGILHKVIVGYQGVGKGAFARTNKKVIKELNNFGVLEIQTSNENVLALRKFITETFGANIGETGTGTDRVSVPRDGDERFNYAGPIARRTLSELVRGGGMVNDDFMTLMVIFEMIKIALQGFDGADVDTFPRTPGQLEIMQNIIVPYLKDKGFEYKTSYQIYEMADAETAQLIMDNRKSAAVASKALGGELTKLSKEKDYSETFPGSELVASKTVGKHNTEELTQDDLESLKVFYRDRAMEIRKFLLSDAKLNEVFPLDLANRDIVIRIYTAHVSGFTKIIGQRVAGRLLAERRGDDNIIYSLLNRIRSTEGTYGSFITSVAEDVIGVDGKPAEAWEMWIKAQLRSANPDLLELIENADPEDIEVRALWLELLEIGKKEHELTINPKQIAVEA